MKQFSNVTTLIFDLGGVLINLDLPQCIQNFKDLGVQNFEEQLSFFGQKGFFLQFEKGQISIPQFRAEVRKLCVNPVTDEQIDAAWCSFLCDIPNHKLEMLLELKKKFKLLLLSNTNQLHIEVSTEGEFAKIGMKIADVFDKCYYSYQMGLAKPSAEIFEAVLSDAGVTAKECLFLDDGPKNIAQAASMGIQTYQVEPGEDLKFLLDANTWK